MLTELQKQTARAIAEKVISPALRVELQRLEERCKTARGDGLVDVGLTANRLVRSWAAETLHTSALVTDVASPEGLAYWGWDEDGLDAKLIRSGLPELVGVVDYNTVDLGTALMSQRLHDACGCAGEAIAATWPQLLFYVEEAGFTDIRVESRPNTTVIHVDTKEVADLIAVRSMYDAERCEGWLEVVGHERFTTVADLRDYLAKRFELAGGAP